MNSAETVSLAAYDPASPALVQKARDGFCVGPLEGYGLLELDGPDAARFLQNQTTQDIQSLTIGQSIDAASVDRHGKTQGVFTVYRMAEQTYGLFLETAMIPGLMQHWQKFKLMDQFELRNRMGDFEPFVLLGPKWQAFCNSLNIGLSDAAFAENSGDYWMQGLTAIPVRILRITWAGLEGIVLLLPPVVQNTFPTHIQDKLTAFHQAEGALLTPAVQELLRIEAGLPKWDVDMDELTLFPETGLQERCVSYTKGCYLGQEVIARVKTYGRTPYALVGLKLPTGSKLPAFNSVCCLEKHDIGIIKSCTPYTTLGQPIALAYMNREYRTPGQVLALTINEQPLEVEISSLPLAGCQFQDLRAREAALHGALNAFAMGNDEQAIEGLSRLIPDNAAPDEVGLQAIEALGVIYGRHDRVEEAIALMQRLLDFDPDSVMAHTNLSIFYLKQGNKELAEEEKAKATVAGMRQKAKAAGFDLEKLDAERKEREAARIKDLEDRLQLFIDALAYNPADPLGNFGLGSVYLELNRYAEAVDPFRKTIDAQPLHSVAYLSLGKAYEHSGQAQMAIETYQKGIEVAASRGDRMPLEEMRTRLGKLQALML